jgi:hypothetical protein
MDIQTAHSLVLSTLERAASQNAEILKPAESKLKEWETEPGFYSILLNIFSNHSIDVNVRWLAVLYFKNGVDRYWRKTAPNAIPEAEKVTLRQGLISNFHEPINQVATQISVLISKIARFDCPREWPELINTLLTAVKSDNALIQHRALLTLHHVIKTLSSKRLAGDRRLFQELTANIYSFILNLWHSHIEAFFMATQSNQEVGPTLEKALLSLRILRKLTVHGFKKPHESQDVILFVSVIFEKAKTMLEFRKTVHNRTGMLELCEKFIIHLTKVLMDILEHHPFSYINFIKPTLEFTIYYIFTPEGDPLIFERFIIQCLNLIKGILLCAEYKPAKIKEETREPATLQAHQIKTDFFVPGTLTEMCRKLVSHYFLLTSDDLQLWDADPESFATDEGGESWKYSLRPCTETLFLSVFHEYRTILSPVLLDMIRDNIQLVEPSDLTGILRKDAVYNAVGLAAYDLYDDVDFNTWFTASLIEELKVKEPNYRIIRRRVVWLVGQWSAVKFSTHLRPLLYSSILPLLQSDEDMAVRIAASNTLKLAIDDFEFNTEQFLNYLEPAFRLLYCLLKEANECDTKMHVLYVMSFIVERVGMQIRPYVGSLIHYLPLLWQESAEHNMLRCAIVSTLVHLVQALGVDSLILSAFLLPVIRLSTDIHQDCHVYLLEDGLELWLAVLENSPGLTPDLLLLFQNMPPLLEFTSENLRTCFYIIQAYILLSPEEFLRTYGSIVIASCTDMLSDMRSEGIVMIMRMVEMCLRALPGSSGAELVQPMLARIIESVYQGEEYPMVMSMYLSIVARVLLCSRESFGQGLSRVAESVGGTQESVLSKVLDVWLDKMSLVTQPERRKLLGLALASLLTAQSSPVIDHFCGILLNITEVLNDITKTDNTQSIKQLDSLMITPDQGSVPGQSDEGSGDCETEHDQRRRQLAISDPVHTVVLRDYFQAQINELQSQVGGMQFDQLLQTVDCETMEQVRDYIQV